MNLIQHSVIGSRGFDTDFFFALSPAYDLGDELHAHIVEIGGHAEAAAANVDIASAHAFQAAEKPAAQGLADLGISQDIEDAVASLVPSVQVAQ